MVLKTSVLKMTHAKARILTGLCVALTGLCVPSSLDNGPSTFSGSRVISAETQHVDLTESVHKVVLQTSIASQIL